MPNVEFKRNNVNPEALDEAIRDEFGAQVSGISSGPYGVKVHFVDEPSAEQINRVREMVQNHDPSVQTPEQQAAERRRHTLEQLRSENADDLDISAFKGEKALIQRLAQRIAWLEQEIHEMRGV